MKLGYAGMTHLGINSAVATAARGAQVMCFDSDAALVSMLQSGSAPVSEPLLEEFMAEYRDRLAYSADIVDLSACELVVIAPDVPTDDTGNSDLSGLRTLITRLDDALPPSVVLVVLSQVPPGFSRELNLSPGRVYYYQVETLVFGEAIERALKPERIIFGCADPTESIHALYQQFLDLFDCPQLPMVYESAELAKIAINCCLVSSVSVANTLAELCEHIGADWSEIAPALKLDRRIGRYAYLSPGLGIAGGNLERDLYTVKRFAARYGTDARVVDAWLHNSHYRRDWVLRLLHDQLLPLMPNPRIAIWGLAYKQDTRSIKNSPSLALIEHLNAFELAVYDPMVENTVISWREIPASGNALAACEGADILVIMTPWQEFRDITPPAIKDAMNTAMVIDPYAVLDRSECTRAALQHFSLGRPAPDLN